MTKSSRKIVPDMGIELRAACMPSELASDRATANEKRQEETMEDRGAETVDCLLLTKPYVYKVLCISRIS